MINEAALTLEYPSDEFARRIERAVLPEVGDIDDDRSRVSLERDGNQLKFFVEANDVVALRASLNTWLSLVTVAERAGGS